MRFASGATAGQGALTEVRHTLLSKVFASATARFLMSNPGFPVWSTETCTGGLPTTVLPRNTFPWVPEAMKIPFAFPMIVLSSTMLF